MKLTKKVSWISFLFLSLAAPGRAEPFQLDAESFFQLSLSANWTTNYGPAYRDVTENVTNLLPCSGTYALCFTSGPEPLPCTLEKGENFATCKCTVEQGLQFVLISGILDLKIYQETVETCGQDGANCKEVDQAPVCKYLKPPYILNESLISTFSPQLKDRLFPNLDSQQISVTQCQKAPYAGCMTAFCTKTSPTSAECRCPVFWGPFQLYGDGAQCNLGSDLVPSASYRP